MRPVLALALLLALWPAGAHAQDESAPPAASQDESATDVAAEKQSGPVAFIASLYETYTDETPGEPGLLDMYSKRLQALMDKDAAETPKGEAGRLDFDPVVDGQDWDVTGLKLKEVYRSGGEARVRATFANMGEPRNILFNLVRENGEWRIDDIAETLKPRWTLSKILTGAPDASPNEKPQE